MLIHLYIYVAAKAKAEEDAIDKAVAADAVEGWEK